MERNGNNADTSSGTLELRSDEATDDDLSLCTTQSTTGTKIVPSDHLIGASLGDPTSNDIDEKLLSSVRKKVKLTNVRKKVKLTNARKKVKLKFVWKKVKLKFVQIGKIAQNLGNKAKPRDHDPPGYFRV